MEPINIKKHEKVALNLRALFDSYGYRRYRMGNFEEYAFYLANKSFLVSEKLITFNDLDGRLMALKPDVTLSIVKNAKAGDKFYYVENVYRPSAQNMCFKEIEQLGLEAIGNIDLYTECEIALLAAKSLKEIDENFALDISHMGLVKKLCERVADNGDSEALIKFLRSKNYHEAKEKYGNEEILKAFFDGDLDKIDDLLLDEGKAFTDELRYVKKFLKGYGISVNIDFSLINDENYYNGIVFRGYVEKVPRPVLSGGRYDKLLQKLDKNCDGLGFAVYLDELDAYDKKPEFDCDILLISNGEGTEKTMEIADALRADGRSVRVEPYATEDIGRAETFIIKNGRAEVYNA